MLTIVQRGGATREKPPETVRGFSSRLSWAWDGLCFAVPFNDSTRDSARDLVANAAPSLVGGTLGWARDDRGSPAASLDTSSYLEYPDNPLHTRPSTALTVYARIRRIGTSDHWGGVFGKRNSDLAPFLSWGIYQAGSGAYTEAVAGHINVSGTTYLFWENPYTLPTTLWASAFIRWSSGTTPQIDVLGERGNVLGTALHPSGAATGAIAYVAGQPMRINATEVTTDNFGAEYSQLMAWSRRLTDTEVQALVADPYGWYSPRRSTVVTSSPYGLPFGGGELRGASVMGGLY